MLNDLDLEPDLNLKSRAKGKNVVSSISGTDFVAQSYAVKD